MEKKMSTIIMGLGFRVGGKLGKSKGPNMMDGVSGFKLYNTISVWYLEPQAIRCGFLDPTGGPCKSTTKVPLRFGEP